MHLGSGGCEPCATCGIPPPSPPPPPPSLPHEQVRYSLPFGLNVENQGGEGASAALKGGACRAVCTKDGAGGEKVSVVRLAGLAVWAP